MSLLEVKNINAFYDNSQVLFNMSLDISKNKIIALLGRNGAGKSSTFKAIPGIINVKSGSIKLEGKELMGNSINSRAKSGIGYVPEDRQVFPEHTVEENINLGKKNNLKNINNWELEKIWETFPLLKNLRNRLAGQLSGGEQQMAAIGRSLMADPKLMIFDEPSLGLSPILVEEMFQLIADINRQGMTILLVEQNVVQSLNLANRAYVIENGTVTLSGKANELAENPDLKKSFLGL